MFTMATVWKVTLCYEWKPFTVKPRSSVQRRSVLQRQLFTQLAKTYRLVQEDFVPWQMVGTQQSTQFTDDNLKELNVCFTVEGEVACNPVTGLLEFWAKEERNKSAVMPVPLSESRMVVLPRPCQVEHSHLTKNKSTGSRPGPLQHVQTFSTVPLSGKPEMAYVRPCPSCEWTLRLQPRSSWLCHYQ